MALEDIFDNFGQYAVGAMVVIMSIVVGVVIFANLSTQYDGYSCAAGFVNETAGHLCYNATNATNTQAAVVGLYANVTDIAYSGINTTQGLGSWLPVLIVVAVAAGLIAMLMSFRNRV